MQTFSGAAVTHTLLEQEKSIRQNQWQFLAIPKVPE
jgi:hypothetical protein